MTPEQIINFLNSLEFQKAILPYKIAFILISIIFLAAIIYFMLKQNYLVAEKGRAIIDFLTFRGYKKGEKQSKKKWQKILKLLEKDIEPEYKLAVLELTEMFSEIFKKMGYDAENLSEQLNILPKETISNMEALKKISTLRDNIVFDPNYRLNLKETKKDILNCEPILKELEMI